MDVNVCVLGKTAVPDRVKMKVPMKKAALWEKLGETEVRSIDDCKVSDAETGIEAVDRFLRSIDLYRVDIFELNTFARKLEAMRNQGLEDYCSRLEREQPDSLEQAVYSMDTGGAAT